jgi:RHS repeat-associated protein
LRCETTAGGTFGVEYDALGRITSLPSQISGGGTLETTYFVSDLTHSQTQDGITNTYELDATGRQRKRIRVKGEEESTEIYHYANGSDSPSWIDAGEGQWSRFIGAIGASAIEKSAGEEITLQLADMHGDIAATADIDPEATELLSTQQFDEYGNPKQSSTLTPKLGWLGSKMRRTELPSGVIQMGVRSYVPAMGRFLTPDPVCGGSANAYEYANGDPVNNLDLTGERCRKGNRKCRLRAKERRAKRKARRAIRRVRAVVRESRARRARNHHLAGRPGQYIPKLPWEKIAEKTANRAAEILVQVDEATSCELGGLAASSGAVESSLLRQAVQLDWFGHWKFTEGTKTEVGVIGGAFRERQKAL